MSRKTGLDEKLEMMLLIELTEVIRDTVEAEAQAEAKRHVRDDLIRRLKAQGMSLSRIAAVAGMSRARVQQVAPGATEAVEVHDDATSDIAV